MRTPQDRGQLPPATLDAIATRHVRGEHPGKIASDLALPLSVVKGVIEGIAIAAEFDALPVDVEGQEILDAMAALRSRQGTPRGQGGA